MNKKSNSIVNFSVTVLLVMLLLGIAAGTASAAQNASATIRAYGDEDIGPGTTYGLPNPEQSYAPNIYALPDDAFNPTVIQKDSITANPAIILDNQTGNEMSADSSNIDVKKFLRMWYEPNHTYNGQLNNPTYHPTIELESTYMLIDSKHKLPISGAAGVTTFAFPIYEKAGQLGLGSLDTVDLNYVEENSGSPPPTTDGIIQIQKMFIMNQGDEVQFLDHTLKFVDVYYDPQNSNIKMAKVEVSYAGNLVDDSARIYDLTPAQTFFDRHNRAVSLHHPDATWYAEFVAFNNVGQAQIIVGKELAAGDTFYVNSVRYDVPAVFIVNNGGTDEFKYITLRTPLPKGIDTPLEASVVSSQWITEIPPNTPIPVDPPFNGNYNMIDDTNVVLWKPTKNINDWPTGPFLEGERYLTNRTPLDAWKDYFKPSKIMVPDTEGNLKWIADEVNGRIIGNVDPLVFTYKSEAFEPRFSTDLLEILNESASPEVAAINCVGQLDPRCPETWTKYIIQTRPDRYTEFVLPPRPEAVPAPTDNLSDAYNGDYLVTLSYFAPDATGHTQLVDPTVFGNNNIGRAAFIYDPNNGLDIYVNKLTDPLVRMYGEDDAWVSNDEMLGNTANPGSVGIYDDGQDPFDPAVIIKDSITFNPAIIEWNGTTYAMSANSKNIDVKKFLRMWYEPNHTYDGFLVNPTYHPTIELESTYMLIDSKHKLPTSGSANMTTFAFPIADKDGQIGLGSFDANIPKDGLPDLVDLVLVTNDSSVTSFPTTDGTIRIQHTFNLGVGDQVQFLDHKLKFIGIFEDPNNNTVHYAKVQVVYAGNVADDSAETVDLGKLSSNPQAITFFDRHDKMHIDPSHPDTTWYAQLEYYSLGCTRNGGTCSAQISVGKEISAGDTYYVNSVRNDVRAVFEPAQGYFKYITISTPLPKGTDVPLEASTVTSQWITEIPPNTEIPVNPPFNGVYSMVADINVILWKPTKNIQQWPLGDPNGTVGMSYFLEGERYLTMKEPLKEWKEYFKADKVMVPDTEGNLHWIADEVNGRILRNEPKLNFSYANEAFERRYSTNLLEVLNETCRDVSTDQLTTCTEGWKWYDVQTRPDQYTEFKLPPRHNLASPLIVNNVENWGDYLVTLSWYANNSKGDDSFTGEDIEHNLIDEATEDSGINPRAAFVYDPIDGPDSTGIYVNELTSTPPGPPAQAPAAVFTVNSPVHALDMVTANPAGTGDPSGNPITLNWQWGDGSTTSSGSAMLVTHQYTRAGTYSVILTVTGVGGSNVTSHNVVVLDDGVMISFQQGWNQVSIPISTVTPFGALFAGVPGYTQTWGWNAATQSYIPAGGSAPVVGQGYFVFASAPYNLVITGTGVPMTAGGLILVSGWNMVGPGIDDPSVGGLNDPITLPPSQFAYNFNPIANAYVSGHTLVPGKGYWISS
jgi:PKD repeat protein